MPYVPTNEKIYAAAFAGAMAQCVIRTGISPTLSPVPSYVAYANVASAWAEAVDTAWASATSSYYEDHGIQSVSSVYHMAHPVQPSELVFYSSAINWAIPAIALVAAIRTVSPTVSTIYNPPKWKDLQGDISNGTGAADLTYEVYRDTLYKMYFFRFNQDDELNFRFQVQHDWDVGTSVKFHLHVVPMASTAGNVVISGYYFWAGVGDVIPAVVGWTPFNVIVPIAAADQYKHFIIPVVTAVPTTQKGSSILNVYLTRPGATDANDTYDGNKVGGTPAANLGLLSADWHYQVNQAGTVNEYPS
jgi:hypothetical protein